MRLGGVTVQVTPNGNLGRGFADLGGLPAGVMAPPRPVPPLAQPRAPKHYSPSLSLGPPVGLEPQRQREASQTAESEQQVCLVSLSLSLPSLVLALFWAVVAVMMIVDNATHHLSVSS